MCILKVLWTTRVEWIFTLFHCFASSSFTLIVDLKFLSVIINYDTVTNYETVKMCNSPPSPLHRLPLESWILVCFHGFLVLRVCFHRFFKKMPPFLVYIHCLYIDKWSNSRYSFNNWIIIFHRKFNQVFIATLTWSASYP